MGRTSQRAWNKTFGIDPDIPISQKDQSEIQELYSIDDHGRTRAGHVYPKSVLTLPYLPSAAVFAFGTIVVHFWQLPTWSMGIVMAVALLLFLAGTAWSVRAHVGPLYRRELRQRGYEICLNCGYWLRGLAEDAGRCPECGKPVVKQESLGNAKES